ncbi:hypothetical protein ACFHW1_26730 [Micromonospora sp. LOL_014]|uniref:effector-associated domain 2-containing protein n=1 Tax=Micromonospora sp. LOL_014 TaxID=3345415 RepID=UPI003A89D13C
MTTTGPQRPDVRVVAVGVGAYQAGDGWTLTGPVDDAVRIARFFVAHGVPTGNVDLLTGPAPPADDLPAGVRRRPADRATVRQLLLRELPASSARELYVYWGGHGFVDPRRRRRLYYADATDADAVNLDLDSLLATYASDLVAALHRQLWLVDVCQTHGPARPRRIDGHETFPIGDPVAGRSQDVLFAAAAGQPAANLDRQRTGLFSRELLRLMDADGLTALADPQRLAERLRARFTTLRADGLTGQTPTYLWYRDASGDEGLLLAADPGGSRKPVERLVRPSTAAIGAVVDALLEIPEFRRPNDREEILSLLPPSVYASIRRNPATRIDAVSIVRGCLHHATGLSELVAAVRFFTSDDAAVDHLAETVRRLAG